MKLLCLSEALLEGHSRGFEYANTRLLAVRREGRVYIYLNSCPHRVIGLEWQPDQFLDPSASLIAWGTWAEVANGWAVETETCSRSSAAATSRSRRSSG